MFGEVITGRRQSWTLVEKLGEGDAGEVYRVEGLLGREPAILKRPHRGGFSTDVLRQAAQIKTESRILKSVETLLSGQTADFLRVPAVLDSSPAGSDFGEAMFVVIGQAPGIDLNTLAKVARFGRTALPETADSSGAQSFFLENVARQEQIPRLMLLRSLAGVIELFERIHFADLTIDGAQQNGILWNDVKADHLFWDPVGPALTVIDWGNSQFLDSNGVTADRHSSRLDDYNQFMDEMGRFLSVSAPEVTDLLEWPEAIAPGSAYTDGIRPLKVRIQSLLDEAMEDLHEARRQEGDFAVVRQPRQEHLEELAKVQNRILAAGELPNRRVSLAVYSQRASSLAGQDNLTEFMQVCKQAEELVTESDEAAGQKWALLRQLAGLAQEQTGRLRSAFTNTLVSGIAGDWASGIWELHAALPEDALPAWWDEIAAQARQQQLNMGRDSILPYVVASRLFFTLQSNTFRMEGTRSVTGATAAGAATADSETLVRLMEEEVIHKWKELEPAPPNSGIEYNDLDSLVEEMDAVLPGTQKSLDKALAQPRAQASLVMDAWGRKEFEAARRGLRTMLLWDPHRRRLLAADRAMHRAPDWLVRVRQGARSGEAFNDYLTDIEFEGRELRNQVGSARWLDMILETLRQLRTGSRPADILIAHPELLNDIPWLNEYRSRETLSLPRTRELSLERAPELPLSTGLLQGGQEGVLGQSGDLLLGSPLDTWTPEARGSSARVFAGRFGARAARKEELVVKLMRPDRADYSLPLFREEAQILTLLRDVPGVTRLVECGFLYLHDGIEFPGEDRSISAAGLQGQLMRYGQDEVQSFLTAMDIRVGQGWIPYLILEKRDHSTNLMVYCDTGITHGRFLPMRESLLLGIQICDILQVVHDRNIVYRDHKILHYYWDLPSQGVAMIDWNISRRHPQGLSTAEKQFDIVQFSARALHHILTGRAAPGALPLGPNRPDEIEQAAHQYRVQWTYDDERLPNRVKEILDAALTEGYSSARELRQDLLEVYEQLPGSSA